LDVRVHNEVLGIDREAKSVIVLDRESTEIYTLSYEKLILSTGASPIIPPIEGIERAFTLRTVEDVEAIVQQVAKAPSSAVIIGGGFIGLEIAENFVHKGIHTTIIEAASQVLAPLDPEMAALLEKELSDNGVALYLGASATSITERAVQLSDGREIPADLVILAIGVRPDTSLVREAGLVVGPRGGVSVNEFNLTNDENIYAIGDLAEKIDELDGSATLVPLANLANRHGRVVADHISGKDIRVVKTIGTAIVKVFNLTVATTGWNEKRLKGANIEYLVIHSHPNSHAGYYPDAQQMTLKLLFAPRSGEIFGAQAVGHDGVDKRIDVIATAIRGEISAPELADLELAYAPPFGSAKDPVNMLGYIAENLLSGLVKTAQWNEVDQYLNLGYQVVDVRTATEFADGTLPSAINLPVDEIRERVSELPGKKVLVTCQVGQRGHTATMYLKSLGYDAVNLDGGYLLWSNSPAKVSHKRKAISNV
jgi:NADPH-dependent 2,4-dienoyl-CoA reductase/sulfur reductase-like enzyme/rhodanese-related sulfurtransferase